MEHLTNYRQIWLVFSTFKSLQTPKNPSPGALSFPSLLPVPLPGSLSLWVLLSFTPAHAVGPVETPPSLVSPRLTPRTGQLLWFTAHSSCTSLPQHTSLPSAPPLAVSVPATRASSLFFKQVNSCPRAFALAMPRAWITLPPDRPIAPFSTASGTL